MANEAPSLVRSMVSNMSIHVQEAMESFSLGACRNPSNVAIEVLNDSEEEEIQSALHMKEDRTLSPLPNLLQVPATSTPPLLSSLPAKAYGLTRPQGFPEFETTMQAIRAF